MARLDLEGAVVQVTLSRRNLLALLSKLDWPESHRTITSGDCHHHGVPVEGLLLVLHAEHDAEHYRDRPEPAGLMHPRTEADIRRIADTPTGQPAPDLRDATQGREHHR